ncbi:hypothetical protein F5Y17DRAFT_174982 [Xylariaceae sp. FL0594]|nr:hypothetical protein F5Y17DRAFT_174982 [Xylariaceae sp. FL0594]
MVNLTPVQRKELLLYCCTILQVVALLIYLIHLVGCLACGASLQSPTISRRPSLRHNASLVADTLITYNRETYAWSVPTGWSLLPKTHFQGPVAECGCHAALSNLTYLPAGPSLPIKRHMPLFRSQYLPPEPLLPCVERLLLIFSVNLRATNTTLEPTPGRPQITDLVILTLDLRKKQHGLRPFSTLRCRALFQLRRA